MLWIVLNAVMLADWLFCRGSQLLKYIREQEEKSPVMSLDLPRPKVSVATQIYLDRMVEQAAFHVPQPVRMRGDGTPFPVDDLGEVPSLRFAKKEAQFNSGKFNPDGRRRTV